MIILLHSSKTMRSPAPDEPLQQPALLAEATELAMYCKTLTVAELTRVMKVSPTLARKTHELYREWPTSPEAAAIDSFVGDIYSGLQASKLTADDRSYAADHLRILSGLYGILRPTDAIRPYRLEMGYRLPASRYRNLYDFWGTKVAAQIPANQTIINLAAVEYSKVVTPYLDATRIIAPRFLTMHPITKEPTFVVVHAKIARGAFAHWLLTQRIDDSARLPEFGEIGYSYNAPLSTPQEPVFVCQEFGGKGLSMRLER